jgi:hypothetical protein
MYHSPNAGSGVSFDDRQSDAARSPIASRLRRLRTVPLGFLFRAANLSRARAGERPVLISGNPAELIR